MTARLTRLAAAILLGAGGVMHFDLWREGYRHIPRIGPLFMANFVMSIALAGALAVSRRRSFAVAGIALAVGSLAALVLSRTIGVLGFTEMIWTPQAINTLLSEVGVIVALGPVLILQFRAAHRRSPALVTVSQP
jgi:hypothetical protein